MRRFEDFFIGTFADLDGERRRASIVPPARYPAAVLVHGDTSSAFAAALAAFHLRIPVVHVEAGLRTGGHNLTPVPRGAQPPADLLHRRDALRADVRERGEPGPRERPRRPGLRDGNTGIDALRWAAGLDVPFDDPLLAELVESDARVVVVTAHRRENWDAGLAGIAEGIARWSRAAPKCASSLPLHPNPRVREELRPALEPLENVLLIEPLRYAAMAKLLARCDLVITDSGGLQEEAPSLGKPVLVARDSTERTEGVEAGTLLLVGTDPDAHRVRGASACSTTRALTPRWRTPTNPYGDGHAAQRIVARVRAPGHGVDAAGAVRARLHALVVLEAAGYDTWLQPAPRDGDERAGEEHRDSRARGDDRGRAAVRGPPAVWVVLFIVAFVVIVVMLAWTTLLFVRRSARGTRPPPRRRTARDGFTWVFLVPALNEEVTIRDSVARLLAIPVARRHIVVIDDGSDDGTPDALADDRRPRTCTCCAATRPRHGRARPRRSTTPTARLGERSSAPTARQVIVVVVDADGRLPQTRRATPPRTSPTRASAASSRSCGSTTGAAS